MVHNKGSVPELKDLVRQLFVLLRKVIIRYVINLTGKIQIMLSHLIILFQKVKNHLSNKIDQMVMICKRIC